MSSTTVDKSSMPAGPPPPGAPGKSRRTNPWLTLIAVAAITKRLSGSPITPAILFVSIGILVGPQVLDGIDISSTSSTVRALAEATLAGQLPAAVRRSLTDGTDALRRAVTSQRRFAGERPT